MFWIFADDKTSVFETENWFTAYLYKEEAFDGNILLNIPLK